MTYNPDIHNRKSIRLKNYDYSQEGLYFITICAKNNERIFGEFVGVGSYRPNNSLFNEIKEMTLNKIGIIIKDEYIDLKNKYKNIRCHEYVVMPNHFHAIIEIIKDQEGGKAPPLPEIIGYFKFRTTKKYNEILQIKNDKFLSLWQRNYYENVIRNEQRHRQIIEYIENNPLNWKEDKYFL